jgi:glyoxylase-like metal-dependent hydrolase (beta-lactamase superfamily II)
VYHGVSDGDWLEADGITLRALYAPGHTNESFSFVLEGHAAPAM